MANNFPFKANQKVREFGLETNEIKIVDKLTSEVLLTTTSSKEASRFIGAYELYIFHIKNGHRKPRLHTRYDIYIDNVKIIPRRDVIDKKSLIYSGLEFTTRDNNKINVISCSKKTNGSYDVYVLINETTKKYFCFSAVNKPTVSALINKVKKFLSQK